MRILPTADINLDNLKHNYAVIRRRTGKARIFAVVKANAYGHGLIPVARFLEKLGADGFCVAVISEIEQLIDADITVPILHLGRLHNEILELNNQQDIRYTVNSFDDIPLLKYAAKNTVKPIVVHLKMDTGMGRLGIPFDRAADLAEAVSKLPNICLQGLWSHLSTAEEEDSRYFYLQLHRFKSTVKVIRSKIKGITDIHLANSAAMLKYPESHFTMVRPGIALYGAAQTEDHEFHLRPVMSLNAPVSLIRHLKKGESLGYNRTVILKQDRTLAIVQAGYADGIPTEASNRGNVLWKGQLFPIVGRVSMDMLAVDVTGTDITLGEMVNFWGNDHPEMRVESVAASLGKIPYELLVSVSDRVEKNYTGSAI